MGRAVFPPCYLTRGQTMVEVMKMMKTSFRRTYASMPQFPGLLYSIPLTPWQATVDPSLCQRLLDTHRQVWVSLLWGHCSFLLVSGAHSVLLYPPRVCFPSSVLDYVKVIMLKVVYLNSSLSTVIELCNLWTQLSSGLHVSHQFRNMYLLSPHCVWGFVLGIRNRKMNKTTS